MQATITDAAQAGSGVGSCDLHALTADFNARRLLALLTAEDAHSMNLWMQQRFFAHLPHVLTGMQLRKPFCPTAVRHRHA